jgi:response regulator RpfG family c-di-GMP phosphodiesterase
MMYEAVLTAVVGLLIMSLWKIFRRKRVWIIDDSPSDIMLYRVKFKLDNYDVQYFNSVAGLAIRAAFFKPDAVVVDYRLKDNVDGDKMVKFCKRNDIPAILITAYDGEIAGIDKSSIYHKSANDDFYRGVEAWIRKVTRGYLYTLKA